MFVIPCKYNNNFNFIQNLVKSIREYHPTEKIVVVDSSSEDKSYLSELIQYDVIVEDIDNKNWMVGAYWHVYKKYNDEDFYYFMHDSMIVKGNLDYLKSKDLTTMCYFTRYPQFNVWSNLVESVLGIEYNHNGFGCYGPIFFCKNHVMKNLLDLGVDKLLPINKSETGICEGMYGFLFEYLGYDLKECALFGDVLFNETPEGKSGIYPHNTTWQYPIEKFYASHVDKNRL